LLGSPLQAPGNLSVTAVAGPLSIVAFLQGGTGGSLADISMNTASGSVVLDQPLGVGAAFVSRPVAVTSAGSYSVQAADLGFPANFNSLAVIVSQGGTNLGEIFGNGTFSFQAPAAGTFFLNFLATPGGDDKAGTYALSVALAPPAPVVALSADAASVSSGGTVHLIWSNQNVASCSASGSGWTGSWTGAQATSNSVTSPAISADATFTLTCTGPGGSTPQSVSVKVAASSGGGGGGGGALGIGSLLALASLVGASRIRSITRTRARGTELS
jgi:hypothetical protein